LLVDAKVDSAPLVRAQGHLPATLDLAQRSRLYFAIAKYKDDLDDPSAFESYQKGNREMNALLTWECPNLKKLIEANEAIAGISSTWQDDHEPIFLVGIPCCGAELPQMVLSQNPELGSLWKTKFLMMASNYMLDSNVNSMAEDAMASIKALHHELDVDKPIADKAFFGFQYCSAIARMFPRAKILHCYRNSIDNLLAIYKSFLGEENPWAYDLDNIIDYFEFYSQIMGYHQASSPTGIIHLDIDAMVENPWVEIRKLIKTCGFEWSDAYLGPEILAECEKWRCSNTDPESFGSGSQASWLAGAQLRNAMAEKLEAKGIS
jgi:hypothetical protein